jgi:hypothetical protein
VAYEEVVMAVITPTGPAATIAGVLARRGVAADERVLARALDDALGRYLTAAGSATLSQDERALLRLGGLDLDRTDSYVASATRTAADYAGLVATALTVPATAARLGVDGSRVRHRIAEGSLWALRSPSRRRLLPSVQFAPGAGVVPGFAEVYRALPDDLHPLEIQGFLVTARAELRLNRRDLSPVDWLLRGGAPAAVAVLAAGVRDRLL